MSKYLTVFSFLILSNISLLFAQRQYDRFKRFNIKNGLSNTSVWAIAQDKQGLMWFGTFDGLNRYDGYHFKIFKNNPEDSTSLAGNFIENIFVDSKGRIWVCTHAALCLYMPDKENFKRFIRAGDKSTVITQVVEDEVGNILVATASGLNLFNEVSQKLERYKPDGIDNPLLSESITTIAVDKKSNIWVGTAEKGILYYEKADRKFYNFQTQADVPQSISDNRIQYIFPDSKNNIWVGTKNGLNRYLSGSHFMRYLPPTPLTEQEINLTNQYPIHDFIFSITEDKDGRIWFGSQKGLHYFDPTQQKFKYYLFDPDDDQSISGNASRKIFADRFGHLWIGGFGGVDRLALYQKPFQNIKRQADIANTLISNNVLSFAKESNGNLWIGTNRGVSVFNKDTKTFTNYDKKQGLEGEVVTKISIDRHQNIWVRASPSFSLQRFDKNKDRFVSYTDIFYTKDGKLMDSGTSTILSVEGDLIFYSPQEKTSIYNQEKDRFLPYQFFPDDQIPNKKLDYWGFDQFSRYWLITDGLLFSWDKSKNELKKYEYFFNNGKKISFRNIMQLYSFVYSDQLDFIWIPTALGLAHINLTTLEAKVYAKKEGLETTLIVSMHKDKNNHYWLGSNAGLYQFNPEKQVFKQYTEADGLPNTQLLNTANFQDQDGILYYGMQNGATYFIPENIKENKFNPPILLTDIQIFNKSVAPFDENEILTQTTSLTEEVTLSYKQSVFGLEYASLNYFLPEKVQYAYFLEGFDKDWNYVKNRRLATYTNLPRGKKFVFKVKATNEEGLWSEPHTLLTIEVTPPWWETWWFRGMVMGLLVFSAYIFYETRTQFLKKQNEKLEKQVQERTQEIEKKSKELEFANHQINTKNEELQANEEELRQNMEELETNQELLTSQNEKLELAFQELHRQNTKVNDSIRYAQRIQNAILPHENILASSFSEHFVIFKPKDVVSGDFYWYFETTSITNEQLSITNDELLMTNNQLAMSHEQLPINAEKQNKEQPNYSIIQLSNYSKKKFLAVVDCTGHGVPGAFMSMIGNTLLYEIITNKNIREPHLILEQLHWGILTSLNKKDSRMQDGMDIALCCIETLDNEQVKVQFSGAKRPLYYFSNQSLSELSADRKSIGQANSEGKYALQEVVLSKGDTLYMTTDGWIDSINPERKRFGSQRFKQMLVKGANLSLYAQKEIFTTILEEYEQGTEQRDDVLMVGVKV
ncbi:MAG: SpoIIE family protein phosphatase [Thermoflexibacter sp.]|jgi:ligand-binding sensor domain-containing protein/serine phosphatase RsbU (regulator of sigma subunit)|nr:SpoIIE family protein phosphatase [Thermoflexibacter sp.]